MHRSRQKNRKIVAMLHNFVSAARLRSLLSDEGQNGFNMIS